MPSCRSRWPHTGISSGCDERVGPPRPVVAAAPVLRRNTIANFAGQGWAALMSLAFVPLYIHYLGIEAYGVIGLYVLLQAWLVLLDLGMTPTLNREMARFTAGLHGPQEIRDLLRSLEMVAGTIAILVALAVAAAAAPIAHGWVRTDALDPETVAQAVAVMGLVMATHLLESLYRSSLIGLQRQVLYNVVFAATATLRGAGVVLVLAFWSATLQAFFLWQALASLVLLALLGAITYAVLPRGDRRARFSMLALRGIGRFAGGMVLITLLSLLLMQVDKLLLSTLLPLDEFGRYALATAVAGGLTVLSAPIGQAWFPRMSQLHAGDDSAAFASVFHKGAQLVSVLTGSAAIFLVFFAEPVLALWTGNAQLAAEVASLLSMLAIGNGLNALMWMPYYSQLAAGITMLTVKINVIAVLILVPAIIFVAPRYGAFGAAAIWATLNATYVLVASHFVFRRVLPGEIGAWYFRDLLLPLAPPAAIASLAAMFVPFGEIGRLGSGVALLAALAAMGIGAALLSRELRSRLLPALASIRSRNKA